MNFQTSKRIFSVLLILIFLFNCLYVPVFAADLLTEIIAVGGRAVIASIIRSLGVSVAEMGADALSAFDDLVESVYQSVLLSLPPEYQLLNAAGNQMIKMVFSNGVYGVPREVVKLVCQVLTYKVVTDTNDYVSLLGFTDLNTYPSLASEFNDAVSAYKSFYDSISDLDSYSYVFVFTYDGLSPVYNSLAPFIVFSNEWYDCVSSSGTQSYTYTIAPDSVLFVKDNLGEYYFSPSSDSAYVFTFEREQNSGVLEYEKGSSSSSALGSSLALENAIPVIPSSWDDNASQIGAGILSPDPETILPLSVYSGTSQAATAPKSEVIAGTKVEAEKEVVTDSTTGTEVETEKGFWANCLTFLKSIYSVLSGLASAIFTPIVDSINVTKTAIITSIESIIEWLTSIGASLADILTWIQSLPNAIAQAIADVLAAVFVPSEDFLTVKVEALRARFDWINPFIDFAKSLSFSSAEPPVIYIPLADAEGSYYFGPNMVFVDMSWYARYKAAGDLILSGFFWALFGWRMYLKLPGIINGVAGTVGRFG